MGVRAWAHHVERVVELPAHPDPPAVRAGPRQGPQSASARPARRRPGSAPLAGLVPVGQRATPPPPLQGCPHQAPRTPAFPALGRSQRSLCLCVRCRPGNRSRLERCRLGQQLEIHLPAAMAQGEDRLLAPVIAEGERVHVAVQIAIRGRDLLDEVVGRVED